ncbi:hypothetical protein [Hydrogenophaga sp.]|uniref:hypothetical protein n=1 Tax=Hydrogenophaga sp. TaxID=1904254 RepID=UPI00351E5A83
MTKNPPDIRPSRIAHAGLRQKIMSAEAAAALIEHDDHAGMSGFTGAGYPKAVPLALARHIQTHHDAGKPFRIGAWTGASTAPMPDRDTRFSAPDEASKRIARHLMTFRQDEVAQGRLPPGLLPLQAGVGDIAIAVMESLNDGPLNTETAVGQARMGCQGARWQGATPQRAHARQEA